MKRQIIIFSLLFMSMTICASAFKMNLPGEVTIFNSEEFKNREAVNQNIRIKAQAARAEAQLQEIAAWKDRKHKAFQCKLRKALAKSLLEDAAMSNNIALDEQGINSSFVTVPAKKVNWSEENSCISFGKKSLPRDIGFKVAQCSSPTSVIQVPVLEQVDTKSYPLKSSRMSHVLSPLNFMMNDSIQNLKLTPANKQIKPCLKRMQELD